MNTIELKQTKSDERTPLEIFNEAETGQAFKVVVAHGEAIGMKCRVNGKVALVDLGQGVPYYGHGDTHTPFADGDIKITPIDIKITEL